MVRQRFCLLLVICSAILVSAWTVQGPLKPSQATVIASYSFESPGGYSSHHPPGTAYPEFSSGGDVFGRVSTSDSNWGGGWGARSGNWFFGWRDSEGVDPGTRQAFVFYSEEVDLSNSDHVIVSLYWRAQGSFTNLETDYLRAYLVYDGIPQPCFFEPERDVLSSSIAWAESYIQVPGTVNQLRIVVEGLTTSGNKRLAIDDIVISEQPVTPHSITLDGDLSDWSPYHERLGQSGNQVYYLTWDAEYLYAAIRDPYIAADSKFVLAIDIDPLLHGSANQGTPDAYCGASWPAAVDYGNKPDYVIHSTVNGPGAARAQMGSWSAWQPALSSVVRGCGGRCAEWRISRSELGVLDAAAPLGIFMWTSLAGGDYVAASWPPENRQSSGVFYAYSLVADGLEGRVPAGAVQRRGAERLAVVHRGNYAFLSGWVKLLDLQIQGSCEMTVSVVANVAISGHPHEFKRWVQIEPAAACSTASATLEIKYEDMELGTDDDESSLLLFQMNNGSEAPGSGYWRDPVVNTLQRLDFEFPGPGSSEIYTLGSASPTIVALRSFSAYSGVSLAPFWPLLTLVLVALLAALVSLGWWQAHKDRCH